MKQTLLALLGCILLSMPMAATAQNYDGFEFTTNADGISVTITGYAGTNDVLTIPSALDGLSVTGIGTNAFVETELTSVTIPESVTNIGSGAFENCWYLTNINVASNNPAYTSIGGVLFNQNQTTLLEFPGGLGGSYTIPNSVTNIGAYAFYECIDVTNVTIDSGVISIGDFAFGGVIIGYSTIGYSTGPGDGCPLSSVTIPDSVISIGAYAFYNCSLLTNVTIGSGVISIGNFAFSGSNSGVLGFLGEGCPLSSVTIPNSVTSIGEGAFAACTSLTAIAVEPNNPAYASVDGVLFNQIQTTLIQFPAGNGATSYTIPSSVTSVGDYAFLDCPNLTNITISDSVTNVGEYSFYDCSALTNVAIGENVISIGAYAFSGGVFGIKDLALASQKYACALATVTIPSSVTSIGSGAFQSCPDLGSVFFRGNAPTADSSGFSGDGEDSDSPPTVYYLPGTTGWDEFSANTGLSTLLLWDPPAPFGFTISNGTISIASYVGSGGSASIPSEIDGLLVTSIGANAFTGSFLTNVIIPDTVTSIGANAFENDGITTVAIPNSVTSIGAGAFQGNSLSAINVAPGNPAYSSVAGVLFNKNHTTLVEYPDALAGNYAIPSGVTSIGDIAFAGCQGLTNVTIPNGVTNIGYEAFLLCSSLTSVTIPSGVPTISYGAFLLCSSLASVTIPDSVTNIGEFAFSGSGLKADYFYGNAPNADATGFYLGVRATAYYLPGTTGWGSTFGGCPTALWTLPYPLIQNTTPNVGVQPNGFSFNISWATNLSVVVEACTNLANPVWQALQTNTLTATPAGGAFQFSDPQWTNYPARFYRISVP